MKDREQRLGRPDRLGPRGRNAAIALSLMATSCSYLTPSYEPEPVIPERTPTSTPSTQETQAAPTPTEYPTATAEPSPTPTEVPMYIGLSADEVEVLRAQCLQENPDSLCLPLPFSASADATVEVVFWDESDSGLKVADGVNGERYLALAVPAGTDLLSPLNGDVWIRAKIPGYGSPRWLNKPGRTIEGISAVSFAWGPFVAYDGYSEASAALILIKGGCGNTRFGGRSGRIPFREGDLIIPVRSQVAVGETLARVETTVCLVIHDLESLYFSIPFPDGRGTASGNFAFSRTDLSDLLRTEAGSIVYVRPTT